MTSPPVANIRWDDQLDELGHVTPTPDDAILSSMSSLLCPETAIKPVGVGVDGTSRFFTHHWFCSVSATLCCLRALQHATGHSVCIYPETTNFIK